MNAMSEGGEQDEKDQKQSSFHGSISTGDTKPLIKTCFSTGKKKKPVFSVVSVAVEDLKDSPPPPPPSHIHTLRELPQLLEVQGCVQPAAAVSMLSRFTSLCNVYLCLRCKNDDTGLPDPFGNESPTQELYLDLCSVASPLSTVAPNQNKES